MYKLPSKGIFNQNNRSDRFSDLWSSLNLDLTSKLGALKISPRMLLNLSSADNANLGIPCASRFFSAGGKLFWVVAGSFVWNDTAGLDTAFSKDAIAGSPILCNSNFSDMEVFNNALYVSEVSKNLYKMVSGGTWSNFDAVNNADGVHAMTNFRTQNRLYFVDDNGASIGSINTLDTKAVMGAQYTLQNLVSGESGNTGERITWIRANSQYIFIGTLDATGRQSKVYYWNGSTANTPDGYYTIEANGSLACLIVNDQPVIFDTRGRLLQLNGGSFVELDRLPFGERYPTTYFTDATNRLIHYNGMALINGNINLFIKGTIYESDSTNKENLASGIWEYTKETGLYHKNSVGLAKSSGSIMDYGQQKLLRLGCLMGYECSSSVTYNGKYLAGCEYYADATTTKNGIFYDDNADTLQKAGGFITSKIFSPNINEIWQKFIIRFRKLLTATDKMVIKSRISEEEPTEFTITWDSTTSFTTTTNILSKEGYEIEVIQGIGSGKCAHVVTAGYAGSSGFKITLDETFTGATGTAKVRMQNWKKFIGTCNSQTEDFKSFNINTGNSTWIQFKVWILSTGKNEVNDLLLVNVPNQKLI